MYIKMNRPMKYGLLAAAAVLSLSTTAAISLWPEKALAGCRVHVDAGLGNGSFFGDPGNSGAHNQAGNAPAQPQSAAAKADPLHEIDDPDEPN
jgi:hypothetical protein